MGEKENFPEGDTSSSYASPWPGAVGCGTRASRDLARLLLVTLLFRVLTWAAGLWSLRLPRACHSGSSCSLPGRCAVMRQQVDHLIGTSVLGHHYQAPKRSCCCRARSVHSFVTPWRCSVFRAQSRPGVGSGAARSEIPVACWRRLPQPAATKG